MSKKRYSIWDWDDDFGWGKSTKKSTIATSWYSYYQNIWKGFDWGTLSKSATNKAEIDTFKAKVKLEADKYFLPIRINVSGIYQHLEAFSVWKYVVNVPTDRINSIDVPLLIKAIQKLPERSHAIHSFWVRAYVTWNNNWYKMFCPTQSEKWFLIKNTQYFEGKLSFAEYSKYFVAPETLPSGKYGNGGYSAWLFHWGDEVGSLHILDNLHNYKEALKLIGKRLVKQEAKYFEENMRKGSRINPKYITWQSQAPLLKRTTLGSWGIPRVMVVVDCSGSMGSWHWSDDRSNLSASFAAALNNSWVADVTHIVYHSDSGWVDMKKKADKWEIAVMCWGGDGFQYMDDNLPSEWVKDCEYVLVLTDLEYWANNQWWLLEYVKRAPAHLILSFDSAPIVDGIKCEKVFSIADMAKATIKLNTKLTR